ncbi:AAA family ATPase [Paraburkholderia sabiae]|uniref:AAA family ATPase n=1 Tax=Paraburkholderia sabiae TaxID=273251 RepID=UPI001CC727FC|nr:AAA family ATPase [Paraburkholderia sabiae]
MGLASVLKPLGKQSTKAVDFLAFVSDRNSEDAVRRYVLDQMLPHTHVAIGTIDDAIEFLKTADHSPDRVLVDITHSSMPISDLARLADVCEPSVRVYVLGERNDVGLFRNLLKLGVTDYLVKPLALELLQRTLDPNGHEPVQQTRAGKVITFVGTRGGIGVTTIALNLAQHLANDTHRRVAYVDLNLRGGAAHSMLDIDATNGLAEVLQNVHRLDPQYVERTLVAKSARFFVLSAELEYGSDLPVPPGGLTALLAVLRNSFHYVVIDAPVAQTTLVEEALDESKRVFIVADRSVHSARHAVRLVRYVEGRAGSPTISLVLNNVVPPMPAQVRSNDFGQAVGRNVLVELPYEGRALSGAENLGETGNGAQRNAFSGAIERLAAELTGQQIAAPTTWLGRVRARRSA